jgi:hypothetical protein
MACTSCKKKAKKVEESIVELESVLPVSVEEIKTGYNSEDYLWLHKVLQASNMTDEYKTKANEIYFSLFKENISFGCGGCKDAHLRKLEYYLKHILNLI